MTGVAVIHLCNHCGKQITAPDGFAGMEVVCPSCEERVQLPASTLDADDLMPSSVALGSQSSPQSKEEAKVQVRCDECFQPYIVPASAVDLMFDCPKCHHTFRVSAEALQAGRTPEASGHQNLKTAAAADSTTLGDELLVGLDSLDATDMVGAPLQSSRQNLTWLPAGLRRKVLSTQRFIEDHPIAIVAVVVGTIAWALVLAFLLR
ncbi:MAG: hypothetical protein MI757_14410 [Pirellulales bacterium]|nr:hypothetical protein [Pirellulales bacterium]